MTYLTPPPGFEFTSNQYRRFLRHTICEEILWSWFPDVPTTLPTQTLIDGVADGHLHKPCPGPPDAEYFYTISLAWKTTHSDPHINNDYFTGTYIAHTEQNPTREQAHEHIKNDMITQNDIPPWAATTSFTIHPNKLETTP
jgi:hypothetical protein